MAMAHSVPPRALPQTGALPGLSPLIPNSTSHPALVHAVASHPGALFAANSDSVVNYGANLSLFQGEPQLAAHLPLAQAKSSPGPLPWRPSHPLHTNTAHKEQAKLQPLHVILCAAPQATAPKAEMLKEIADIPDFLSGFDRVTLSLRSADNHVKTSQKPQLDDGLVQCSPMLTSRSFDDFHRLLGKDLHHLEPSPEQNATAEADHTASFSADAYAIFAAETAAVAASQHAAYMGGSHVLPGRLNAASLDALGVAQRLSEDAPQDAVSGLGWGEAAIQMEEIPSPARGRFIPSLSSQLQQFYYSSAVVSGSEPSQSGAESESAFESMQSGTDNASYSGTEFDNSDASGSDSEGPKKKRAKVWPDELSEVWYGEYKAGALQR